MKNIVSQSLSVNSINKLTLLRKECEKHELHGWVQPMNDNYFNEWLPESEKRILWLTKFSGSAGTILITLDKAALFVDSRYIIQASKQVDLECIEVVPLENFTDWISSNINAGKTLGYDENHYSQNSIQLLGNIADTNNIELKALSGNLIDNTWIDRPSPEVNPIWPLSKKYSGVESIEKQERLLAILAEHKSDAIFITKNEAVCWLLNIRGNDIKHTPVALCRALLYKDGLIELFINPEKILDEALSSVGSKIKICAESEAKTAIEKLGAQNSTVIFDTDNCPIKFIKKFKDTGGNASMMADPVLKMQSVKNTTELNGARASQIRDGVALTKFLMWVSIIRDVKTIDEFDAAIKLGEFRKQQEHFIDLSFSALSSSGPNAAMNHYIPERETARELINGELYLIDSGGQYLDGTTDTTRTIALAKPSSKHITSYTYVLKSHIALATAVFPKGTNGRVLDAITRAPMWRAGLNYGHGTGHGVGSCLNVHEFPPTVSYKSDDTAFVPGMLLSNEPGYYVESDYGIRIENMMIVIESNLSFENKPFYQFETITRAPLDKSLMDVSLLTHEEIDWINNYHRTVWKDLHKYFEGEELIWLKNATELLDN